MTDPVRNLGGRPTKFTVELGDAICSEMAEGRSLRSICREDGMPNKSTVFRWLRSDPVFCDQYTRAQEDRADAMFEDMITIADDTLDAEQVVVKETDKGAITRETKSGDAVDRARLMVETRKWALARMAPKKYGEKIDIHSKVDMTTHWREDEAAILERIGKQYATDQAASTATNRKRKNDGKNPD